MKNNFDAINQVKTIGLVYDEPLPLNNSEHIHFSEEATWEWESQITLDTITDTWKKLGFNVIHFPLNKAFFRNWSDNISNCDLIHSVVEGFGSMSREAWIPSMSELSGVPYIGSSPFAHSFCMSKSHLKRMCQELNIPTAPFYFIKSFSDFSLIPHEFFNDGVFVKPDGEGSGMGVDASFSVCSSQSKAWESVVHLLEKYPEGILLEKYLAGPEYTSAVIGTPAQLLPVAQIEVEDGVYGAIHKGKDKMGEKVTFPTLNSSVQKIIAEASLKLFNTIPLHDFVRIDWKCDLLGNVYLLEANTLAGLSYHYSVLPLMAREAGIDYNALFASLARSALSRAKTRNLWYGKTRLNKL